MAEIAAGKSSSAPASRYPGIDVLFGRIGSCNAALDNSNAASCDCSADFSDSRAGLVSFDSDYKVHSLQVQAIINSVGRLGALIAPAFDSATGPVTVPDSVKAPGAVPCFSLESALEHPGIIIRVTAGNPEQKAFLAGMLAQSIILKAAEMGLAAIAVDDRFVALGRIKP